MRTITQRTTLPFLIAESGAASFTLAVMMSPKPARNPRSPPRGKIHCSRRAPLLSATSRIVRIPIIKFWLLASGYWLLLFLLLGRPLFRTRLNTDRTQIRRPLHRFTNHFAQLPALQLAHRAALDNAHHIARLSLTLF